MEAEGSSTRHSPYSLQPIRFYNEDILFCIDIGLESQVEMKVSGPKGRPITRLESIKQAILLFVHSKLTINPDHRFAFASLSQVPFLFLLYNVVGLFLVYSHSPQGNADLTQLFRIAAHESRLGFPRQGFILFQKIDNYVYLLECLSLCDSVKNTKNM
ncbi:hypothetical protein MKX03_005996 [Papaver bracteatum]|nr:hypothetical protein MKX03_005996 [Papaver bracteatum]